MKTIFRSIKKMGLIYFLKIPPRIREQLIIVFIFLIYFADIRQNIDKTKEVLGFFKKENPLLYQNSKTALKSYSLKQPKIEHFKMFMDTYKNHNMKCIKKYIDRDSSSDEPIMVCAVKNDLTKIKMQLEHHKSIGINNYVYIDNMSDDGTYEWLSEQEVDLYRTEDKFHSSVKESWIRKITDIYGYNRWYLILDSDELFVYPYMENKTIQELIYFAKKEGMFFIQSFLIDMYSKGKIFDDNIKTEAITLLNQYDIKKNFCYFDLDSYLIKPSYKGKKILGGPRLRVFGGVSKIDPPLLTKNPLIYLKKEDIFRTHHSLPYYKNFHQPIISGILHYKFLPNEKEEYIRIAEEGRYFNNSFEYKQYIKIINKNPNLYFYYSKSQKFNNSLDLLKINIFDVETAQKFFAQ